MYLFSLLSSLLCIQLISLVVSATSDASPNSPTNVLYQAPNVVEYDSGSDEDDVHVPRSAAFLRFGRENPSSSGTFLRFGRSQPSFLRFGRGEQNGKTFLRFGRKNDQANANTFLRFGRQAEQPSANSFLRFGRKGEFLRFG